ncbi:cell division ATP-binding protein FtsE [Maridesulfovibrio ferrireducens]|uniref:Cell division ATP-binding protein FtsE n=1 Tax=Maridesulfovibrio ferrireducens TaxID=246191 RepID=A0A1G9C6Q1_9BACT|nr:cell division ATP-binding protein FtsE [Maridesulfovibrio ferrireducens]MBI9111166.1 cell division ATP-binding protein FtsE [Maridesulfovibrio ferrireducens]SDK47331.1 cell division transport system ATP-binding protein [Maridesulfovibrio ferrireducens]
MIRLNRLSYSFGSNWALKDISLHVDKGEFIFLTGHSGAGKTTLMRLLYGALPVTRGQASVAGYDLHNIKRKHIPNLRRELGVVFQDFKILPNRSVYENVALALTVRSMPKSIIDKRVRAIIRALGLESKTYSNCHKLSGGEQQRVAIARSMVVNPKLILADEPTGNLDFELSMHLMDVFKQFHTHGTTIIMATHSREILRTVPDAKIIHLEDGQICEPPDYILSELNL